MPEHQLGRTYLKKSLEGAGSQPPLWLPLAGRLAAIVRLAKESAESQVSVSMASPPGSRKPQTWRILTRSQGSPFTSPTGNLWGKLKGWLRAATSVLVMLGEPHPATQETMWEEMPT